MSETIIAKLLPLYTSYDISAEKFRSARLDGEQRAAVCCVARQKNNSMPAHRSYKHKKDGRARLFYV